MNKRLLLGISGGLIILLMLINQGGASAQGAGTRLFEATGHWVSGEFLEFYDRTIGAKVIYGDPITDAFDSLYSKDPAGTMVQYFERARFELHPENPPGLRVTVSLIGEYLYAHDDIDWSVKFHPRSSSCRNIPQNGYPVCYAFLSFFEEKGGIAQFGYPISELVMFEGRMVQYFQRARFEWHPELPNGEKVVLSAIGMEYFLAIKEDPTWLSIDRDWIPECMIVLQANAFVDRAIMAPNGMQEVFVVVQNQFHYPVVGAHVTIKVIMPSGDIRNYSMPLTNSYGISQVSFIVPDEPAGLAQVSVEVRTSEQYITTETSFRIWK